jgi:dUTP pyrophosphatase
MMQWNTKDIISNMYEKLDKTKNPESVPDDDWFDDQKNYIRNNGLCVTKMHPNAILPTKGSINAAGYDLYAFKSTTILPWKKAVIDTKIKILMPVGVYGRVASRSSLSFKHDLEVGAGVIDTDYRGEIKVLVRNMSGIRHTLNKGDRIAQIILERYTDVYIDEVSKKDYIFLGGESIRGKKGFGSTGK